MKALKGDLRKVNDFSKAIYDEFYLKKGFYYGHNIRGQSIATSTFQKNGSVLIYTKTEDGKWQPEWVPVWKARIIYPMLNL